SPSESSSESSVSASSSESSASGDGSGGGGSSGGGSGGEPFSGSITSSLFPYAPLLGGCSGAIAFRNLGTTANAPSVTFTHALGSSGVAFATRWNSAGLAGFLVFVEGNNQIFLTENNGALLTSTPITLTVGNSYTLSLADSGTAVPA